ncbi:MAG: hypothetical protein J5606_09750 [Bacteroidales bacterium]|nr:hypothetical protein [Bacteroidales bacterium]
MRLFKAPEKRTFNYKPRFYDKSDEEIKKEKIVSGDSSNIEFGDKFHHRIEQKRQGKQLPLKRLLIMVAILLLLLYIMSVL